MRAVVQRVTEARVIVENEVIGEIGKGILVFLGIGIDESEKDIPYLSDKIINLRIFDDAEGKMNLSLADIKGELLIVSQFTLFGDTRHGKRPDYTKAARPETAEALYEKFIENSKKSGLKVETGKFRALMKVEIQNDGPVTLLLDSKKEF